MTGESTVRTVVHAILVSLLCATQVLGQPNEEPGDTQQASIDSTTAEQLVALLQATEWFDPVNVRVDQGVVVLDGSTSDAQYRDWAGRLALGMPNITNVENRISVTTSSWDLTPAWEQVRELTTDTKRLLPSLLIALLLLIASWFAAKWAMRGAALLLKRHLRSRLLRDVIARAAAVPVLILGLYSVLSVLGLTGLAATLIGGTGLVGIIIGFACRDIAENFLASVLISMQRPFATGDLIRVDGSHGYVQSVNTRSTLLMTLEGNHVQIPNATIYKNTITNYTANPKARFDFVVGIGYADSIQKAQAIALRVLQQHPAVIDDPEPAALVESLGAATVSLRIYFWIDIAHYSHLKTRSSVIRRTKTAFEAAGISMPDEAREVVFPAGVPVHMVENDERRADSPRREVDPGAELEPDHAPGEDEYITEAREIERQASQSRMPEGGPNLLEP